MVKINDGEDLRWLQTISPAKQLSSTRYPCCFGHHIIKQQPWRLLNWPGRHIYNWNMQSEESRVSLSSNKEAIFASSSKLDWGYYLWTDTASKWFLLNRQFKDWLFKKWLALNQNMANSNLVLIVSRKRNVYYFNRVLSYSNVT